MPSIMKLIVLKKPKPTITSNKARLYKQAGQQCIIH